MTTAVKNGTSFNEIGIQTAEILMLNSKEIVVCILTYVLTALGINSHPFEVRFD